MKRGKGDPDWADSYWFTTSEQLQAEILALQFEARVADADIADIQAYLAENAGLQKKLMKKLKKLWSQQDLATRVDQRTLKRKEDMARGWAGITEAELQARNRRDPTNN